MPALDFVNYGSKKGKRDFGLELYHMPDNWEKLEKHNPHSKIFGSPKRTYLDEELKTKEHVPAKFYEVGLTMLDKSQKSPMGKAKRKMMGDDIKDFQRLNNFPAPN